MTREQLNLAFSQLRKQGYFAKKNYTCCHSCAWSLVRKGISEGNIKDKIAFYTNEDLQDFEEGETLKLNWVGAPYDIMLAFSRFGITTSWDGNRYSRIQIIG